MNKISAVVSAYNEEAKIEECLESLRFCDEIILVDNSSTDKTADIGKKFTSKIYHRENNIMLNVNKNYGFSKATGDWILSLDADERITSELKVEIKENIKRNNMSGYWIPRKNIIFGKWIQSEMWWPDYQLRLFKKNKGKFPQKHVHEYINIDGDTEKLHQPMIHENYSSINQYLHKMQVIYSENEVKNLLESGVEIKWTDAIRFPVQDFLKTFFLQKGYKDGLHGLVLSILQAFYMEIVFAKLWEKKKFEEYNSPVFLKEFHKEYKKVHSELEYWLLSSFMDQSKNIFKKMLYRLSRKSHAKKNL
ncbi:MAG: glycosyltransferase family 2 protein [Patescibacteria group bacterium]